MYNAVTAIRACYNKKIKPVKAQRQWLNLTQLDSLIVFKYSSLSDTGGWHAAGLTVLRFPHFLSPNVCSAHMCSITQLYLTLCDSVDYSLPGSSDHGIFPSRIFEVVAILPPRNLPDPGIEPHFLHWQMDSLPLSHQGSSFPPKTQSLYDIKNLFSCFILFRIIHMY